MHIQNNDIKIVTSQNYIWHPITNKLYFLTCQYYYVVYKNSCSQLMIFVSFSIEKHITPCSYRAPFVPPNLLYTHKSNSHLANSLATAVSEPALYRLLTFQVPNIIHLFLCLGRTKGKVQVRGSCLCFVTMPVSTERSC